MVVIISQHGDTAVGSGLAAHILALTYGRRKAHLIQVEMCLGPWFASVREIRSDRDRGLNDAAAAAAAAAGHVQAVGAVLCAHAVQVQHQRLRQQQPGEGS